MTFTSLQSGASLMLLTVLLTGCGLTQSVTDGAVSITKAIFCKKIKVLHHDFEPRAAAHAS